MCLGFFGGAYAYPQWSTKVVNENVLLFGCSCRSIFSSCILLIEVFFFYVVIFTFHTCHLFLFPLTILYVTLHFLSQDGFPATVSFLTVKPVQANKKKREGKKKKTWLDEKQTNKNYCNSIEKGISAFVFPLAVSRWALKGSLSVTCQRKHNCTFCSWSVRDKNSTWNAVLVGGL